MSGGSGTRLWPASRSDRPKQFLPLVDDRTMVRATLDRLAGLDVDPPLVVANAAHDDLVRDELTAAGFDPDRMILEPFGRNTAPAAAVAALELTRSGDDPLMLLLPADHVIEDVPAFHAAASRAFELAAAGYLVTFGIVPSHAETGYGYIRTGEPIEPTASVVAEFVEKPDTAKAEEYLASGQYLWNSGMFVFRCSDYLQALGEFAPEMKAGCEETMMNSRYQGGTYLDADRFRETPADSIDYAVMEQTDRAAVVPLDAGWNDVGSWTALWEIADHDTNGNVVVGDVTVTATTNSYVRSDGRLVAVAGLDNIVVVDTPDAVLVTSRDNAQAVKTIVELLKGAGRPEATESTRRE
jgi:mannose-1-phosphate guanylyltransferase/mannose-6-phosphate isomerase